MYKAAFDNPRGVIHLSRGMQTFKRHNLKTSLMDIVIPSQLPPVPEHFGHIKTNDVSWGMLGNDTAGDCVCAGACHETMLWNIATGKPVPTFSTQTALDNYRAMQVAQGEPAYNPANPDATDTGLDPIQAAAYRQQVGIKDDTGALHKIGAFVAVDNLAQLDLGAFLFGTAGCAFQLPDDAEDYFSKQQVWSNTTGAPSGGHYIPYGGKNSAHHRFFVTWGVLQAATKPWIEKYFVGGVVYLDMDYFDAKGFSPEGLNQEKLQEYLQQVAKYQGQATD